MNKEDQTMSAAFFVSHGAPVIALENNVFTQAFQTFGKTLQKSRAIVVMSAHWMARSAVVGVFYPGSNAPR